MTQPYLLPLETRDVVARVRDEVVTAAAGANPALALPDRVVLSAGGAVQDCAMLSVSVISIQTGFPENQAPGVGSGTLTYPASGNVTLWTARLDVAIVRCAAERMDGNSPPKPDWIEADLIAVSADASVLIQAAMTLAGGLGTPVPHSVSFSQPQGGFISTAIQITCPLWPM